MQTETKTTTLPQENPDGNAEVNALITMRILQFYRHLVEEGCIDPLSTDGPPA